MKRYITEMRNSIVKRYPDTRARIDSIVRRYETGMITEIECLHAIINYVWEVTRNA